MTETPWADHIMSQIENNGGLTSPTEYTEAAIDAIQAALIRIDREISNYETEIANQNDRLKKNIADLNKNLGENSGGSYLQGVLNNLEKCLQGLHSAKRSLERDLALAKKAVEQ